MNAENWLRPHGPVFVLIGGEGALSDDAARRGKKVMRGIPIDIQAFFVDGYDEQLVQLHNPISINFHSFIHPFIRS